MEFVHSKSLAKRWMQIRKQRQLHFKEIASSSNWLVQVASLDLARASSFFPTSLRFDYSDDLKNSRTYNSFMLIDIEPRLYKTQNYIILKSQFSREMGLAGAWSLSENAIFRQLSTDPRQTSHFMRKRLGYVESHQFSGSNWLGYVKIARKTELLEIF